MRDLTPGQVRAQQRKKLHGVLLPAIAEQVQVKQDDGTQARYPVDFWKVWLKRVMNVQGSSEALDDDAYGRFVWDCEVYAVTVLLVKLPEQCT